MNVVPLTVTPYLEAAARDVDASLHRWLPGEDESAGRVAEALRWSVLAPGKRFRPALVLAACESVGGDRHAALPAACAVELVHAFSLIHDDLPAMDDDVLRRGRETSHVRFGEATAILAGDAAFALAFELLARETADSTLLPALVRDLAEAAGTAGMIGGQVLDLLSEGEAPDLARVQAIHERKTAALIRAACAMGARLGGADALAVDRLREFGARLGLAFQIKDDLLDLDGSPLDLGKPVRRDAARQKQTWPAAAGREGAAARLQELTESAVASVAAMDPHGRLAALAHLNASRGR
ncbi:MAG: hypothetical protein CMJ83_03435 [Planctomycetes bacterium]|nr:hypothetical protein [Planctomycetota bacterium]